MYFSLPIFQLGIVLFGPFTMMIIAILRLDQLKKRARTEDELTLVQVVQGHPSRTFHKGRCCVNDRSSTITHNTTQLNATQPTMTTSARSRSAAKRTVVAPSLPPLLPLLLLLLLTTTTTTDSAKATTASRDRRNVDEKVRLHHPEDVGRAHTDVLTRFASRFEEIPTSTDDLHSFLAAELSAGFCDHDDEVCRRYVDEEIANGRSFTESFVYLEHLCAGERRLVGSSQRSNATAIDLFPRHVDPALPADFDVEAKRSIANVFVILSRLKTIEESDEIDPSDVLRELEAEFERTRASSDVLDETHRMMALSAISVSIESATYWVDAFNDGENVLVQMHQRQLEQQRRELRRTRGHGYYYYGRNNLRYDNNDHVHLNLYPPHSHYNNNNNNHNHRDDDWDDDWKRHDDDDDRRRDDFWRFDDDYRHPPNNPTARPNVTPGNPTAGSTSRPTVTPGNPTASPVPPSGPRPPTPSPSAFPIGSPPAPSDSTTADIITVVAADVIGAIVGAVQIGTTLLIGATNDTLLTLISAASKAIIGSLLAFVGVFLVGLFFG